MAAWQRVQLRLTWLTEGGVNRAPGAMTHGHHGNAEWPPVVSSQRGRRGSSMVSDPSKFCTVTVKESACAVAQRRLP